MHIYADFRLFSLRVLDNAPRAAHVHCPQPPAPAPCFLQFTVGQSVKARWKSGSKWYKATVVAKHGSGTYSLKYADGDTWASVPAAKIRTIQANQLHALPLFSTLHSIVLVTHTFPFIFLFSILIVTRIIFVLNLYPSF